METEDFYIRHIVKMVRGVKSLKVLRELYYELLWIKLNQYKKRNCVKSRHRQSLAPVIAAIVFSRLHKAMFKNIFHDLPIRLWFIPPSVQVHQLGRLSSNDKAVIPLTPQI